MENSHSGASSISQSPPLFNTNEAVVDKLLERVKTSDDLCLIKCLRIRDDLGLVLCETCSTFKNGAPSSIIRGVKASFGHFVFCQTIARSADVTEEELNRKQYFEDFLKKNRIAGMNVGRCALFCIRSGLGGLKFEESLNLMDLCGAPLVLIETPNPITKHRPAFPITVDKATFLRRSVQITMILTIIDGEITPIYLKAPSPLCLSELTGKELATNCVEVLQTFGLSQFTLQQQLVGGAVDGAYLHLNIDKHLYDEIGMNVDWLCLSWDPAHLIGLAVNDLKKKRSYMCYGKSYEQLIETADELDEDILDLRRFHETRFVSSERRVYETIFRDWAVLYKLHEKSSVGNDLMHGNISARTRMHSQEEDDSSYNRINDLASPKHPVPNESNVTQEMNSISDDNGACGGTMAFDRESPIFPDNDGIEPESNNDRNNVEKENIENTYLQMYYEDLKLGIFKERPITRGRSEYGLEDPTEKIRTRLA
ncbi:unnamed protein product [Didymodactylos carnosus]|uniref:Uncharacterized protein n=1 Tax=Didymodactylos carnosus TaxID=1234261 RepID=A0A814ENL9_9BILA|nr:unnamed protein product [Didymodactylos carnosus]CAF3746698.1 unnamed protein product [Didymodactylos carnosus]